MKTQKTLIEAATKLQNFSFMKITPPLSKNYKNPILKDVNMKKLYEYIKERPAMQAEKIYNIVLNFRKDIGLPELHK